jgi:hypothetical protein
MRCHSRRDLPRITRQAGTDTNERLQIGLTESHAAAVKHTLKFKSELGSIVGRQLVLLTPQASKFLVTVTIRDDFPSLSFRSPA